MLEESFGRNDLIVEMRLKKFHENARQNGKQTCYYIIDFCRDIMLYWQIRSQDWNNPFYIIHSSLEYLILIGRYPHHAVQNVCIITTKTLYHTYFQNKCARFTSLISQFLSFSFIYFLKFKYLISFHLFQEVAVHCNALILNKKRNNSL